MQRRGSEHIGRGVLRLELEEEQAEGEWMRGKGTWSYLPWENRARWRQAIGCGWPWRKRPKGRPSYSTPLYNQILEVVDGIIAVYKPSQQRRDWLTSMFQNTLIKKMIHKTPLFKKKGPHLRFRRSTSFTSWCKLMNATTMTTAPVDALWLYFKITIVFCFQ